MTLTITRNEDVAQDPVVCDEAALVDTLTEVVAPRNSAGVRLAITELARKLADGEPISVEEQFLGVNVQTDEAVAR